MRVERSPHDRQAGAPQRTRLRRAAGFLPGVFAALAVAMLIPVGTSRAQSGLIGRGTINARIIHKAGIALVFNSNPGGVALGGSGFAAATLDFGTISRFGTISPLVTRSIGAADFTVSTLFDVLVEMSGASTGYNLTAALAAAPGVYAYQWDTFPLSTTAVTVVTNNPNYNVNQPHTLYLRVPFTAPAGAVANTINVTATAN